MPSFDVTLRGDRWELLGTPSATTPITVDAQGRTILIRTGGSRPAKAVTAGNTAGGNPASDGNRYLIEGVEAAYGRLAAPLGPTDSHRVVVSEDGATAPAVSPFLARREIAITCDQDGAVAAPGLLAGATSTGTLTVTAIGSVNLTTGVVTAGTVGSNLTLATGCTVNVAANGSYTLTAGTAWDALKADETAQAEIEITITDGTTSLTDVARVRWTVRGVNDGPTAQNKTKAVNEAAIATGNLITDATAASHPQGEPMFVTELGGRPLSGGVEYRSDKGVLEVNGETGAYRYVPFWTGAAAATTTDVWTFKLGDRWGALSSERTLTVTITGV